LDGGVLCWQSKKILKVIQNEIHLRDVASCAQTFKNTSFKIVVMKKERKEKDKGKGKEKEYSFEVTTEAEAFLWVSKLNICIHSLMNKFSLIKVAERILLDPKSQSILPIVSLNYIDTHTWSVDGALMLTEWKMHKSHENSHSIEPIRQLQIVSDIRGSLRPGPFFSIECGEIWMTLNHQLISVKYSHNFNLDKKIYQDKTFSDVSMSSRKIDCGCVVSHKNQKEVWVSAEGKVHIWNLNGNLVDSFDTPDGKMVSHMSQHGDKVRSDQN